MLSPIIEIVIFCLSKGNEVKLKLFFISQVPTDVPLKFIYNLSSL